jgi:hypothetical protein
LSFAPLDRRGIAYGFAASIALFGNMDSENDSHKTEGVGWGSSRRLFGGCRTHVRRHDLLEVLVIALAAVLCGAETCSDMAEFGQAKEDLLRLFLRLEHGIPCPCRKPNPAGT